MLVKMDIVFKDEKEKSSSLNEKSLGFCMNLIDSKQMQREKALSPMLITVEGMKIDSNKESLKAPSPILFNDEFGEKFIDRKFLHFENAKALICLIPGGITILFIDERANKCFSIE